MHPAQQHRLLQLSRGFNYQLRWRSGLRFQLHWWHAALLLYDPVGDVYVHHAIGQTLVRIDPTTFVGTAISPSGGATPTTAMNGGQYEHYRFFYWAAQDAYVAMPTGDTVGVYVYPPLR